MVDSDIILLWFYEDQHKLTNRAATVFYKDETTDQRKLANCAATVSTKDAAVDARKKK